ncbi:hypothetical protein AGMMS50256_16630 [Betaproteobacteria bacterium]|nr:hypothetical protein AGMMS50256_16630 [Betaproteobacteria bacterium]
MRQALERCQMPWDFLQTLDDDAWRTPLGTTDHTVAQLKETPDWDWAHSEMGRPDATLEQLWQCWREQCPDGISYSSFTKGYKQ